jgi:hypothetical protein
MESDSGIAAWRDTSGALLEIVDELKNRRVGFLLAILPVDMQLSPEIADIYRREYGFVFDDSLVKGMPQKIIAEFARRHGIAFVDLLPSFRKDPQEEKFFRIYGGSIDWNHPNRLGHRIIGEQLNYTFNSLSGGTKVNLKARRSYQDRPKQRERAVALPEVPETDGSSALDNFPESPFQEL